MNNFFVISFFASLTLFAVLFVLFSLFFKKGLKLLCFIGLPVIFLFAILLLIFLIPEKEKYQPLNTFSMYAFSIILVAVITLFAFLDKSVYENDTRSLAFAGVLISLAFALSFIKIFSLPQGGSVTLASMLPLLLYSYMFGVKRGILAGVIYGILQIIQSPQVYQPMQVLLDYPIAFGAMGVCGILKNCRLNSHAVKFTLGAILSILLRYLSHFLSGYYVFSSWALEGYTALTWSLVYNLYVIVELVPILIIGIFLLSSKTFTKQVLKI